MKEHVMAIFSDERIEFFDRMYRDPSYKMPQAHFHDKHELYYLEKGKTKYFIGNEIYLLEAGDLVFIPKGIFHKTDRLDNSPAERLLLVFDSEFAGSDFAPYIDELKNLKLVHIPVDKQYLIRDIIGKIEQENRLRQPGYVVMEQLYLRQLLVLISRYRMKDERQEFNESYRTIQSAVIYISEHYSGDLSLDHLSQKYALSRSRFSKLFKEVTGVRLTEYINITRISAAEKLLAKKSMSITEVAERCGFNDSNYFAAVFKKLKGTTPKKYSSAAK
jgi:AraC-like DNA-binding protein